MSGDEQRERRESFVRTAMELAEEAAAAGDRPFGAVLADATGAVVARDRNRVSERHDPLAHAEINVIRAECRRRGGLRLDGLGLYTNAAPCAMCVSAAVTAGIAVIAYGAPREAGTVPAVDVEELVRRSLPRRIDVHAGVLGAEAAAQLGRLLRPAAGG